MFRAILIDPPWPETLIGRFKLAKHGRPDQLAYPTMTLEAIKGLPVADLAADDAHCWLWVTNRSLPDGFACLAAWGFKYQNTITYAKPSGFGAWWINRTQHLLFGYRGKCEFRERYKPTIQFYNPTKHSTKPNSSYELVEQVSYGPHVELFARQQRAGWTCLGNAIDGRDITETIKDTSDRMRQHDYISACPSLSVSSSQPTSQPIAQ